MSRGVFNYPDRNTLFVVAPTGAGKSTWIKASSTPQVFGDADHDPAVAALYKELKNRFGPAWWSGPVHADARAFKNARMPGLFEKLSPSKIWFTAEAEAVSVCLDRNPGMRAIFIVPSAQRLTQQQLDRAERQATGGRVPSQPVFDLAKNTGVVKHYRAVAAMLEAPVYEEWPTEAALLQMRVTSGKEE